MKPLSILAAMMAFACAPVANAATFKVEVTGIVENVVSGGAVVPDQPVSPGDPFRVSFTVTDENAILRPFGPNVLEYQGGVQAISGQFGALDFATTTTDLTALQEQGVFVRVVDDLGGDSDAIEVRGLVDTSLPIQGSSFATFGFAYDNYQPPHPPLFDGLDLDPAKFSQDVFDLASDNRIGLRFEGADGETYFLRGITREVTVSPVPLPGSAPLMAAGLAGVAALSLRKRRARG